jgi:hypothetical protein
MVMAGHYYCSNREYVDMIKALGACDGNAHDAAILYPVFHDGVILMIRVIRRVEQRLVDTGHVNPRRGLGGRPGKLRSKCLTRLLISLALARVQWQEDTIFTKQHCINAGRDTASTHIDHNKYRHYSLGTGNIAHNFVDGWWKGQTKTRISSRALWTD